MQRRGGLRRDRWIAARCPGGNAGSVSSYLNALLPRSIATPEYPL